MENEFDPSATAHVDLQFEEVFPEIRLEADKFELWFQPVYELATGKVLHNEVLVRWRDAQGNLRQPQELLMVLQNTQLLYQLDRIVVEKSIQVLAQQPKVMVSINLSDEIFADQQFPHQLHQWLSKYNVTAKRISFEISESILCQMQSQAIAFITELKMIGCSIVIDDFTGKYFSLSQLQELPLSMIKLDRSFAQQPLALDQKKLAIAIAYTSKVFQKHCIVKGIDDKSSLQFANELGVKGVQGYSLSQPQDNPKTFGLISLLISRIIASTIAILILLYIFKSLMGIDLFKDRHAWEVISDFFESIFGGK
ncbi:MAG: EAL domain-containing protein [Pseudanabaena sp. M046S1SP1A06QC]|nr:EAL domain-containing protein [Pseudanabaena sp. M046S1SP1A06QC]